MSACTIIHGCAQMRTSHLKHKHYSQEQGLQWLIHIAKGLKYLHTARPMASPLHGSCNRKSHLLLHCWMAPVPDGDALSAMQVIWRDAKLENVLMRSESTPVHGCSSIQLLVTGRSRQPGGCTHISLPVRRGQGRRAGGLPGRLWAGRAHPQPLRAQGELNTVSLPTTMNAL